MIKTFEEFQEYYTRYGKCPNQLGRANHTFNERELQSKWKSYQKAQTKKSNKQTKGKTGDPQWDEVSQVVHKRDKEQCRLLSKLRIDNPKAYEYILSTYPLITQLDLAHVISRTSSKNLYYDPDNIVLLCRPLHSMLDTYHDPVTGRSITKEEVEDWWKYIIGEENYLSLTERR